MKKLSTIIALALIVTIGGVYAAWHYDRGAVSLEITRTATMASIQSQTSKGTIEVCKDSEGQPKNSLKFLVDDKGEIDWVAELDPSGAVTVKFTPSANAEPDVRANGIRMKAVVTVAGDQTKYNNISVFKAKPAGQNEFVINDVATLGEVQINAADIANCLVFNADDSGNPVTVKLPTYQDNLNYEKAMNTYIITITITEA